jgi:hypothetical protein
MPNSSTEVPRRSPAALTWADARNAVGALQILTFLHELTVEIDEALSYGPNAFLIRKAGN